MVGVARGHQKADTLKPYSQKSNQSNHTRITALPTSMKLSQPMGQSKTGGSWWRCLTECGPLEKGITRRHKKAFFSDQCKEIEENNRMGKTRDLQEN